MLLAILPRFAGSRCSAATRRGKTWIPPRRIDVVVEAATELDPAVFHDPQAPALGAVLWVQLSSSTTPWAMLCICKSRSFDVKSSSNTTVQRRVAKKCFSARICRR